MDATHNGRVLALPARKITAVCGLLCVLLLCAPLARQAEAQTIANNRAKYDNRWGNLGFLIGLNIADAKMNFGQQEYDRRSRDGLRYIGVRSQPGITLGIITNLKLHPNFDLRFIPAVALTQRNFDYQVGEEIRTRRLESSYADLPLMLKFKSNFWAHHRVYVMTGPKFSINMVDNTKVEKDPDLIKIDTRELSWEFAFGIDIYGEYVKLCPEIRYSLGLHNVYIPEDVVYGEAITSITTQSLTFCLNFE